MTTCPVCGTANGACGHQALAFPPIHAPGEKGSNVSSDDNKVYLPQQRVRPGRGVPGYKGRDVVVMGRDGQPVDAPKSKSSKSARSR